MRKVRETLYTGLGDRREDNEKTEEDNSIMSIGKSLSLEHTELTCLQCRSRLTVNYKNNVLTVRETIAEYTAK